jgi:hypothetical protein
VVAQRGQGGAQRVLQPLHLAVLEDLGGSRVGVRCSCSSRWGGGAGAAGEGGRGLRRAEEGCSRGGGGGMRSKGEWCVGWEQAWRWQQCSLPQEGRTRSAASRVRHSPSRCPRRSKGQS